MVEIERQRIDRVRAALQRIFVRTILALREVLAPNAGSIFYVGKRGNMGLLISTRTTPTVPGVVMVEARVTTAACGILCGLVICPPLLLCINTIVWRVL